MLTPPVWSWLSRGLLAGLRSVLLAIGTLTTNITLFVLFVVSTVLTVAGVGIFLVPLVTLGVRAVADLDRRLLSEWTGVAIPSPYRPRPANAGTWRRFRWVVTDPATWRDLAWLVPGAVAAVGLGLIAFAIPLYGLEGMLAASRCMLARDRLVRLRRLLAVDNVVEALLALPQGALFLASGWRSRRWLAWSTPASPGSSWPRPGPPSCACGSPS